MISPKLVPRPKQPKRLKSEGLNSEVQNLLIYPSTMYNSFHIAKWNTERCALHIRTHINNITSMGVHYINDGQYGQLSVIAILKQQNKF